MDVSKGDVPGDPFLELYNGNGDVIFANNNWRENEEAAIQAPVPPYAKKTS